MIDHPHQSKWSRRAKGLVVRLYSLGLLVSVTWVTYLAFTYLFTSVFSPNLTPDRFTDRPVKVDLAALDGNQQPQDSENRPTAPLNHYHGVGKLAFGQLQTGCLTSGCHSRLPHNTSKTTRALANFHVAFLDCSMCHRETPAHAKKTGWQSAHTGEHQTAPALLQLMARFEGRELPEGGSEIIDLTRSALVVAPNNPLLEQLLIQMETSDVASPMHRHALAQLRAVLPAMARGDYGAVIAPRNNTGYLPKTLAPLVKRYFSLGESDPARESVSDKIHEKVVAKPQACQQCHDAAPIRVDFAALGYPPLRIKELQSNAIVNMVQQIREGQPFYLPDILEAPGDE